MNTQEQNLKDVEIYRKFLETVGTSKDVIRMFGTLVYRTMGAVDETYELALSIATKGQIHSVLDNMKLSKNVRSKYNQALQLFELSSEDYIEKIKQIELDKKKTYLIPKSELEKILKIYENIFVHRKEILLLNLMFYTGLSFERLVQLPTSLRKEINIYNRSSNTITIDGVQYVLPNKVCKALYYLIDPYAPMDYIFWGVKTKYITKNTVIKYFDSRVKLYKLNRNYKISDILYTSKRMR